MARRTQTLVGVGEIFIKKYGVAEAMRFLGEAGKAEISFDEEKKTLPNRSTPGGGNTDSLTRISNVKLTISGYSFDAKTLAMATYGEATAITGAAVTDESHVANKGGYIRLKEGISLSEVSVKKDATTLVEGTDYTVKGGGIYIQPTTTAITDGSTVLVDYTHADAISVQAVLNSGAEYQMVFDGFNSANDDSPLVMDVYRAKCAPAGIGLITDDFGNIDLVFELLKDSTITEVGASKFFKITHAGT